MTLLPLFILLPPLLIAVAIAWGNAKVQKFSAPLAIAACGVSFLSSIVLFFQPETATFGSWDWIAVDGFRVELGFETDRLARLMLLVVTGVGLLIEIFSTGYMKGDKSWARFFASMSFFLFSMIGVALANNLVLMFVFWELVGLSSYLLIGFWLERPSAGEAAKKAFIVNRIGDVGFLAGILLTWQLWGSVHFEELRVAAGAIPGSEGLITVAVLLLFCGCVGKSAQFPLHVWLPDAMEGPTPVSALIHAATMVAAGVYLLCRLAFLLELSAVAMTVIAIIGAVTALMAALIAVRQDDLKRILAFSTMSQLGYMVMAAGLGAFSSAMFHLTTHAFFKALLFLGAGSVLHALHHEQNIWKMGGLQKMRMTWWTFLIGSCALAGVPFFSGFFSKEMILTTALESSPILFAVGVFTAGLTAFYMTRTFTVAFLGKPRDAHESPAVMTIPLIVLAVLAVIAGFFHIPGYLGMDNPHHNGAGFVLACSLTALVIGAGLAWWIYRNAKEERLKLPLLAKQFYFNEIYRAVFVRMQDAFASASAWFERWIVEGTTIRLPASFLNATGSILRYFQNGSTAFYAFLFVLGVLLMGWGWGGWLK